MTTMAVKSQIVKYVKETNKKKNMKINSITSDYYEDMDQKIKEIIEKSMERANKNNRKTLMGRDI